MPFSKKRRRQGYLRRLNSACFPASPSAGIIQIRFDGRPATPGTSQLASASSRSPFNYNSFLAARSELVNSLLSFLGPQDQLMLSRSSKDYGRCGRSLRRVGACPGWMYSGGTGIYAAALGPPGFRAVREFTRTIQTTETGSEVGD